MDYKAEIQSAFWDVLFALLRTVFKMVLTVLPVYFLWNSVMPVLGVAQLTFFQAAGVLLLVDLLMAGY